MAKIAVTGLRGVPASFGGVEHQCEHLYSRLAARGHEITIYARKGYVSEGLRFYRGMQIRTLPTIATKYTEAILHTFISVLDILKTDFDIVHFYGQGPCLFTPLTRLFKKRTRVFFTCGGLDYRRKKWPLPASLIIQLGEVCSAYFTHCRVAVSRDLKSHYESRYGVSAHYIPNGMPSPVKRACETIHAWGLAPGKYFLFVGRLVPEKRVEDVIAAYLRKPRGCALAIVGESAGADDYVRELKKMACDEDGVFFLGYRYGVELEEIYSNARGFINASELEGLPLTVLEAMSYGLVCLTSDIPAHREIAELCGSDDTIFGVGDTERLSQLMDGIEALNACDLEARGSFLSNAVSAHYSWDAAAVELEKLYMKSLESLSKGKPVEYERSQITDAVSKEDTSKSS